MQTKSKKAKHTIRLSETASLLLYSDMEPHDSLTARLQKGLVLASHGTELVGEGTGFGVPVARYEDTMFFAGSSRLRVFKQNEHTIAVKEFFLDTLPEKWLGRVRIENKTQRRLSSQISDLYQKNSYVRNAFEALRLKNLSLSIGVRTRFVRSEPVGKVNVTYEIKPPFIRVKSDFEPLKKSGLRNIFLLNEQSSRFFGTYQDSNGIILYSERIGAWERVTANWACVSCGAGGIGFRLWQTKGAVLRRGREFLDGVLDWCGLDYEVSSEKRIFEYDIEVFWGTKGK